MSTTGSRPSRMGTPRKLLTIDEAAERMGTGVRFVRRLIAERRIPFHKLGARKTRIDEADVEAFIAQGRVEPRSVDGRVRDEQDLQFPGDQAVRDGLPDSPHGDEAA